MLNGGPGLGDAATVVSPHGVFDILRLQSCIRDFIRAPRLPSGDPRPTARTFGSPACITLAMETMIATVRFALPTERSLPGTASSSRPRRSTSAPSSTRVPRPSCHVRTLVLHPFRAPRTRCSEPSKGSSHQPGPATPAPPGAAEATAGGPSVPPLLLSPVVAGLTPSSNDSSCLLGPVPSLLGLFSGGFKSGPFCTESSSEPSRGAADPREGP